MFFAPRIEHAFTVRALFRIHVITDRNRLLAYAAQDCLSVKLIFFPADNRVRLTFIMAFVAGVKLSAAFELNRYDIHGTVVVYAASLVINKFSENSHIRYSGCTRIKKDSQDFLSIPILSILRIPINLR